MTSGNPPTQSLLGFNTFTSFSHSCLVIRDHGFPTGNSYCRSGLEEKGFARIKNQTIKCPPLFNTIQSRGHTDTGYKVPASLATQSSELEPQAEQDFQVTSDFRCLRFWVPKMGHLEGTWFWEVGCLAFPGNQASLRCLSLDTQKSLVTYHQTLTSVLQSWVLVKVLFIERNWTAIPCFCETAIWKLLWL